MSRPEAGRHTSELACRVVTSEMLTGSGVSDEELKSIGSKALDTLECRDLKKQIELIMTYYRKDARFVDNLMDITVCLPR